MTREPTPTRAASPPPTRAASPPPTRAASPPPTREPKHARGLFGRVVLLAAVGALLPMTVVGWMGAAALADLSRQIVAERQALAESVATRLEDALRLEVEALSRVEADPEAAARLRAVVVHSRLLVGASLLDRSGAVVWQEPSGAIALDAAALAEALASGRPGAYGPVGGFLHLLVPLHDRLGQIPQVAAARIDPANPYLREVLRPHLTGAGVDLVDRDGKVLAASLEPRSGEQVQAFAPLSRFGWRVALRQDRSRVFAVTAALLRRAAWALPLALAVAILFAWGAAESVKRPLATLTAAAERIAAGGLDRPIPPLPADEVGRLGRSLETMRAALKSSVDELEERVAGRTRELLAMAEELRDREERRARLLRKVITAQEDERKRIARELHDETCQTVTALAMSLPAGGTVDSRRLAQRALDSLHRLIFDLRPSVLDDLGLLPAIRWWANRQLEPAGVAVRCEMEEPSRRLPAEAETAVFRIAQEALTNIARHAHAENVLVQVAEREGRLRVEIEDDGDGFDPGEIEKPSASGRGLGVQGMRERVEILGGTIELEAAPGDGTRVAFSVPLP